MQLFGWLKNLVSGPRQEPSEDLYGFVVQAARKPHIYSDWQVADSVDGRFDVIVLHLCTLSYVLTLREESLLARGLQECFIRDMDRNLREMGVGDMSVGKRIKDVGAALFGRNRAYAEAFESAVPQQALASAIAKNVFRSEDTVPAGAEDLARYILSLKDDLNAVGLADLGPCLISPVSSEISQKES